MHMNKLFKIYSFLFIVLMASFAYGVPPSLTTVTATLTDSAGQVWINGTWRTELVPPFGNPNKPVNNGNPTVAPQSGSMDGTGSLSVILDDNLVVTPGQTKTKFTLCPNATVATCTTVIVTVTGASQSLTAILSAALTPVTVAASPTLTRAYNTTEVTGGLGAQFVNVTDGLVYQCTLSFCVGLGWTSAAGLSNATAIQGNSISPGAITTPGQYYAVNNTSTALELRPEFNVDSISCGLPIDGTTDSWPAFKNCGNNHPGATIQLRKTTNVAGACDYTMSNSFWFYGNGGKIIGRGSGAGNQNLVTVCMSRPGPSGFIAINQSAQGTMIDSIAIKGAENFSRTTASTFRPPFGFGYPGLPWITGTGTASTTTLTVNGTNEVWTNQTDNQTVEIYGGGIVMGTASIATTANNSTVTCACTPTMIGETAVIPGAGVGGGILYTRIISLVGAQGGAASGNAFVDVAPSFTVGAATVDLRMNYYGTISSHSSASSATITPALDNTVTNTTVYVGSRADGYDASTVGAIIDRSTITAFGRSGIHASSNGFGAGAGSASQLVDNAHFEDNLIQSNRGNGMTCQGADCNVIHMAGGTISVNQYWGVDGQPFLGSSFADINAAGDHNDCTFLPCPALGGATGGALNSTATWLDGIPYATANAPIIFVTDGTCTNGSNVITTTATGKFKVGHADAVAGSILKAINCGPGGSTDLITYITGFTNANSVTVQDNATCGGSCPGAGAATLATYQTINTSSGTTFTAPIIGHSALLEQAGPDGQALVTTVDIVYSTTKIGLHAGARNRNIGNRGIYFSASIDYAQEQNWYKAWDFTSGSITTGTTAVTTSAANELFLTQMCSATPALKKVITIKNGGPGGLTDHVSTCQTFTNSHAISITEPVGATVSGGGVQVAWDGGPYKIGNAGSPDTGNDLYIELDEFLHGPKYGPVVRTLGGLTVVNPAIAGSSSWSYLNTYSSMLNPAFGNTADAGGSISLFAGRNVDQQFDLQFCGLVTAAGVCPKYARFSLTSTKILQAYVNEILAFNFAPGALRDYKADTGITSGIAHRFTCNSDGRQCFAINADGSLLWGCSAASTNCTKFANLPNTATRTITFPDASGTVALVSGATSWQGCNGKGLGDGFNAIPAQTYPQFSCVNNTGFTITLTGVRCWTDNVGTSTLNATNNAGTGLLTGAVTCNATKASGGAAGTQSATTTLANGDAISFTFVADGTSKQTNWTVTGTY